MKSFIELVGVGAGRGPGAGGEALVGEELGPGRHAGRRREEAGLADREAAAAAVQHRGAGDTAAELEPAGGIGGLRDVVLIVTVIHILYHISVKSGIQRQMLSLFVITNTMSVIA